MSTSPGTSGISGVGRYTRKSDSVVCTLEEEEDAAATVALKYMSLKRAESSGEKVETGIYGGYSQSKNNVSVYGKGIIFQSQTY
jgi:hypothetical protein